MKFFNFFFKNGIFISLKIIEKIHIDSEKSINSTEILKNDRLPDYSLNNYYFLLIC